MIIGVGFKARSGKDTIALHLVNKYSFAQESFAFPLKEYIGRQICGFNDKQLYGGWKEVVDPEWGMTPRQMLQLIGTDALRDVVHPDFWVIPMRKKIEEHIRNNRSIVISDVRMFNEAELIKKMGGILIKVDRTNPDKISSAKHKSELELENFPNWDYIVNNNGTVDDLFKKIDHIMKDKV